MYPAAANVNEARKALWDKTFRAYKKLQISSRIAAVIVNGEIDKKISGHLSVLPSIKCEFRILKAGRKKGSLLLRSKVQIPRCRVVEQLSILCKAGAMAGAVPGVLLGIPLQCAAHVGAAP